MVYAATGKVLTYSATGVEVRDGLVERSTYFTVNGDEPRRTSARAGRPETWLFTATGATEADRPAGRGRWRRPAASAIADPVGTGGPTLDQLACPSSPDGSRRAASRPG